jgi:hypothetical protein
LTEVTAIKERWPTEEANCHQVVLGKGGKVALVPTFNGKKFPGRRTKQGAKIFLLLIVLVFLNQLSGWLADLFAFQFWPRHLDMAILMSCIAALAYIILLAIPFLPGIEIGLMLMSTLGRPGILVIYCCTLFALSLSFLLGRVLSPEVLARVLGWFHLERPRSLVEDLSPLNGDERFCFLMEKAPSRLAPWLLRHRYLIIALLFNLPGNAIIGGGGGIGLVAGMSRLIPFPRYLLLTALAILPGPVFFMLSSN